MYQETLIPKIKQETRTVKMTFELKKDLQENEVICPHCNGTGLRIEDNVYGIKGDTVHVGVRFPYKNQSLSFCKFCYNGVQKKCLGCGALRGRHEGECACGYDANIRRKKWAEEAKNQWNKCEKITLDEAFKKYEYLYIDNLDRYVSDEDYLQDYIDEYIGEDGDISALRIYVTSEKQIFIDAEWVIQQACEDLHEDAYNRCDANRLQKLLDQWCDVQTGTVTYYPDYSIGVEV